jgi:hypothetical protein
VRPPGCPIRIPWDLRLPAPPPGISPRGRVLPRPPSPRHPPCARLPDVFQRPGSLHSLPTRFPTIRDTRPARASARTNPPLPLACLWHHLSLGLPVQVLSSARQDSCFNFFLLDHFHAVRVDEPARPTVALPHPRPQDPSGLAWRIVKVQKLSSGDQYREDDTGAAWVEPRGFEPRTSALQRRRSPN